MTECLPFGDRPLEPAAHPCTVQEAPFLFLSSSFSKPLLSRESPNKAKAPKAGSYCSFLPWCCQLPKSLPKHQLWPYLGINPVWGGHITTSHLQSVKPPYISLGTTSLTSTSDQWIYPGAALLSIYLLLYFSNSAWSCLPSQQRNL